MPGQVHWMVNWAPGTATAQCIGDDGNPVPGVSHTLTTAGAESKIVLTVLPEVVKPDGTSFQWTANGSDAAFVQAEVQDAQGNWVPTAMDNVTFTVTGTGGTYMGGTQQLVADPQWTNDYQDDFSKLHANDVGNLPYGFFHAPGDPELNFEGGLQKIALRSTFTPGPVTVTASALGLGTSNTVTLTSVAPPPPPQTQPPAIIVPPVDEATTVGYPATFTVSASGGGTLGYQWYQGGSLISGATSNTYTTPNTTLAESGETFTVTVSSTYGSVSSNPVTLTVAAVAPVAITTQPASQAVVVGQSATLSVAATGSPALNYAWYENGGLVQSGPLASFTTPILTATGTATFYVIVSNPVGHLQSNNAVLTIAAPTPVSIVTEPVTTVAVANNQPVQISAVVAGSAPYTYQWNFTPSTGAATILGASTQLLPTISYVIPQFSSANVGAYTVTVNNAANAPVTSTAAKLTLAPPGVNLALDKVATASSSQNPCTDGTTTPPYSGTNCLGAENAVDGVIAESSRWGSALANAPPTPPVANVDPSWLQVDLGSSVAFNTVVIYWENAYATQYAIQYTNGDPTVAANWQTAFSNLNGIGGIDQESFPTVTARYIRVLGQQRETQYGYSVLEFQVYDIAQCGGASERYTVSSSSNPSLVTDNTSGLTWTRTTVTDSTPGSQFTGVSAANYCNSINMRLPTASEALTISGNSDATCAFPGVWSTWTSTVDPNDATRTAIVNYDSTQAYQVTVNYPGETLCALSPGSPVAPAIQEQPQSATSSVGQTATFTVIASGTPTPTYQWYEKGAAISGATNASYTTQTLAATDNGDTFYVVVTNSVNNVTSTTATLTVTAGAQCTTIPAVPTGLTATANSSSSIGLSWTADTAPANCAISSYNVYGSTTSGFTPSAGTLVGNVTTGTSYTNTGLTASTTYYYVVEAVDTAGSSSPSSQTSATTPASGPAPDFTLGASPATLSVTAGNSGTETVTVTPENGFSTTSTVAFTCSGLPTGATCSFTPAAVNAAGNIVSTLTVTTTIVSVAVRNRYGLWFSGSVLAVALCFLGRKKRRSFELILLAVGMFGLALLTSCGGTSSIPSPKSLQPVTSTVTITATAGSLQHTTTFLLIVQSTTAYAVPTTPHSKSGPLFPSSALAGVFCFLGRKRRRGVQLLLAASLTGIGALSGCGSSFSGTTINPQPTAPSITTQPVSQTVALGQTATFNVVASGTAPLTYQWQSNGTAISGATAANYTTPAAVAANSGTSYKVVVTNSAGSVTSSAAVLTVTTASCGSVSAAPTGLAATASSSTVIGLGWTAVTPPANCAISSYSVYRSTTSEFTPSSGNLIASGLTSPNYSDTGLSPSTTYYYAVEAIDGVGSSVPSAQASAETMAAGASCTAVPSAPAGVTATASSSSVIGLSWTAVIPPANCTISSYSVYGSTTNGFTPSSSNLIAGGVTGTTYSSIGLTASTTYYYVVEAVDGDGSSTASAQQSATTLSPGNNVGYVSIDAGGGAVSNSGGGDNSFVADEYYSAGGTTDSTTNAITIPAAVAASAAPAAVYQSARQGVVTYTIPNLTAGTSYIVRLHFAELYFTASGNRKFNVAINGTTVLTNFDIYATAGAQYTAVVEQFTEPANSSGQIVIAFTNGAVNQPMFNGIEVLDATPCTTLPAAPTGLTATAAYPSVVNLNWSAVTPPANCAITSYKVYGGTTANPTTLIGSGLNGTTFSDTGLTGSTTYYYVVEAVDAAGDSTVSGEAIVTTPEPVVIAPATSLTAVGSSPQQVDLRWVPSTAPAPNTAPVNYSIYRSTTPDFTPSAANLMGTTMGITNYVDNNYPATLTPPAGPGVQPGTTYYYQVIASTLSGVSEAATASATSLPATPSTAAPAALTGLTAMAEDANEIDLIWNSTNSGWGTAVTTYNVYRSAAPSFTPSASNLIGNVKTNWYQDALVSASTQYYYQVIANNKLGGSASSVTVTATTPALNPNQWGGAPFWDASGLPAKQNVVMLKFLNRTNGKYTDDQITWWANINGVASQFTLAQQPYYDMPANPAGRMYFYLNDPTLAEDNTHYWDFIEFTVGDNPNSINVDTTRVDALGVKLALQLTCNDGPNNTIGTNIAVGENIEVFKEDRSVTFQRYANDVPSTPGGNFQDDLVYAPYRIIEPGGAGFNAGGPDQNYYADYISQVWAFNDLTVQLAGPNASGIDESDLSAAIYRHTAPTSGTVIFSPDGNLNPNVPQAAGLQGNPAVFYQQDPYDHYAQWIDAQDINNLAYGFPYNDNGGLSSDVSCNYPQTLLVAIGW
jgi:fibronectin type 3 domain-containing protein